MSTLRSTTIRLPVELRDEIARIAERKGSTMVDVVSEAIEQLERDDWWRSVRRALDDLDEPAVADLTSEGDRLDATVADRLDDA